MRWKHTGQVTAVEHSELLGLSSPKLQAVMACELQHVWEPGKYARLLLRYVEHREVTRAMAAQAP